MNKKIFAIPLKHILWNVLLLVSLAGIFAINVFVYLHAENQFIAPFLFAMNMLILIGIASFLVLFYLQFKQFQLAEYNRKLIETQFNEKLTYEMQALGIHDEKMRTLVELSELIQACDNIKEAAKAIAVKCRKILHFAEGALYITNPENNSLEFEINWGESATLKQTIAHDQCWALRTGAVYQVKNPQTDLICEHVEQQDTLPYMCIPLMAQNAIFGLLCLDFAAENPQLSDENKVLIAAVSETLSLALGNIRLRESLRNQSLHDSLTGLYNRRFLDEFLLQEVRMTEQNHSHLAILMLDIDFFKEFNDKYGHEAGDLVLQELGHFFQKELRAGDVVCRYGGEEFICILHDCDLEHAKKRAEELRIKISNLTIPFENHPLEKITASIGVAIYPDDADTISDLIVSADQALYIAKNAKRNKVVAYSEAANI